MDVNQLSSRDLLRTYAKILTALLDRGITRSRNAPAGDLAEYLVRIAYDGILADPSEKSWDVQASDGRKLQVKSRVLVTGAKGTQQYSPFRSWDFSSCVFVNFDAYTYEVVKALEVPVDGVRAVAAPAPHVGATAARLHTKSKLEAQAGALDVTSRLQSALRRLD